MLYKILCVVSLCPFVAQFALAQRSSLTDIKNQTRLNDAYRELPLRFEANIGQSNSEVKFISRQRRFHLFLTAREAVMMLAPASADTQDAEKTLQPVRISWIGANAEARTEGVDELQARSNYFIGNDKTQWRTNVPNYAGVAYHNIYSGVDLVFYGDHGELEYDLIVQPEARADVIRFGIKGANKVSIDPNGDVILDLGHEQMRLRKPIVYQPDAADLAGHRRAINGRNQTIEADYVLVGSNEVRFELGQYDHSRPLVIDPQVTYSSYIGGSGDDDLQKVAIDSAGNAYIIGFSKSLDFPRAVGFQGQVPGTNNVVVSKLNPDLSGTASLIYSTYLGGSGSSVGRGIAVDSSGQVYLGGDTNASNFPFTPGAFATACKQRDGQCSTDVFAAKLNAQGSQLLYSTYLGGTGTEFAFSLAINGSGHIFLTGPTDSTDLPVTRGAFQMSLAGGPSIFGDTFVAEIDPAATDTNSLRYLTYVGGTGSEQSWAIAVDHQGAVLVTGSTTSTNFPITAASAYQGTYSGSGTLQLGDAFVLKLRLLGQGTSDLVYSTYLGGGIDDRGEGVAVDALNFVYVTGFTTSSNFPVLQNTAYQPTFGGGDCLGAPCGDAFIVKLDTSAKGPDSLVYSSFFGGDSFDLGHALAVDDTGHVYIAGETASTNLPLLDPIQSTCAAGCFPIPKDDVFVAKLDLTKPQQNGLLFSTYLGGNDVDTAWGLAADSAGNAYVVGQVFSTDFPTVLPYQAFCNNCTSFTASPRSGDGFLFKLCTEACTTANLVVASRGAAHGITLGRAGSVQVGYAKGIVQSGDSGYGVAVFSLSQDGVIVSEAGVPASSPTTAARLFIDYGPQVQLGPSSIAGPVSISTGIAIVNPGTTLANVTYTLRDPQGRSVAVGHGTLPAGAHRARFIQEFQNLAADFVFPADFSLTRFGSLEIAGDWPLSILGLRLTMNQRGNTLLTTVPVADLKQPPSSAGAFFPQVADGAGYSTSIVLLNTSGSTQSGTVRFFRDDGSAFNVTSTAGASDSAFRYSIAPGAIYVLQTDRGGSTLRVGSAQLVPDSGSTAPVGAGIFSVISGGVLATESGIPSATPTTHGRVFVDLTKGHNSGLALAAASNAPISVNLQAFQTDGVTPVSGAATRSLSGNGHTAAFASEFIANLPPNFIGVLDISAGTEFAALTLRTLTNARGDVLLTTFPVADLAHPSPPPSPLVFPQIADGSGYQTEYILLSAGGASRVAVSFFADDGSPLAVGK